MLITFYADRSRLSHADNSRNNILVLGKGPTNDINDSVGAAEKNFRIDFGKANTKFCLSLHYNGDNSDLFVNGK